MELVSEFKIGTAPLSDNLFTLKFIMTGYLVDFLRLSPNAWA